ncbi:hypothetical protein H1P_6900001 [Hyella patelloides LEGE 07179]|uniref:Uncharacterized protein n=1 Tax=Hyella patelloides LEGE 07179 TaxID=945734 RepID=A0A563W337_9CYAN|nr:hypothetical protein H1P_6900001 [Hyella patelloides LEGE 07179]
MYQKKCKLRFRKQIIISVEKVLHKIVLEPTEVVQKYLNLSSPFTYSGVIRQNIKLLFHYYPIVIW